MMQIWHVDRRTLLAGAAAAALVPVFARAAPVSTTTFGPAKPLPLSAVRLLESPWLEAIEGNRRYLHALEPDRLLHNFRASAGLEPKGAVYGGWESDTIAGHSLGHYLTALSLMYAQTGDEECKRRAGYIIDELAAAQTAHGDGYVAGFTRKRGDAVEDGKAIFAELKRGDIRSMGFDLNGCWVPFYNWHKLFAGLFDAQELCGNAKALPVAVGLGTYIDGVFAALNDDQVQQILDCEHGGINESFAELHARTKDPRWLRLAERLRHRKILDPLSEGTDSLPWIHANTQIPKIIGLARLHELTGKAGDAAAARFFWETVIRDYSYVIGGNADREYFPAPRTISKHITEQTCESCNSYNMLKLTRHLYGWRPEARLFDYYERAHTNHILAHQDPATGMFAYMVPLMSGSAREFSKPFDDFWCCVGSGMESHAKHGDSVWWQSGDTLLVNLYIASTATWESQGASFRMETAYPFGDRVDLTLETLGRSRDFAVALRIPGWCEGAALTVNGKSVPAGTSGDYAVIRRRWAKGDRIALTLPMRLRTEAANDDPATVALLHGPVVLAADLGPADQPFEGPAPALVAADLLAGFAPVDAAAGRFRTTGIARPADLSFAPFYQQRDRRTAVYFKSFDDAGWAREQVAFAAEHARQQDLARRSVDVMNLGEMQPERDHGLTAKNSYAVTYRGRHGRDARTFGFFEYRAKVRPGPLVLQATYWGEERNKLFDILIDGTKIATQALDGGHPGEFFTIDYPIPADLTRGKGEVTVRFQPANDTTRCGPVFGVRIFTPASAPETAKGTV
ncbi:MULTISPECIES: glycoside hydrolase family 127 protein [unclassified Sphingopyxis]|uniref:glycoside hydrolase family 127 protein n=1 Tax=unclassified Sphingopyxis TaxID=2614943 RepID=UPI000AD6CE05|nr:MULTISPECIES: glycoside hydrolase family 127 protein [unclassified Sphingopyxis]